MPNLMDSVQFKGVPQNQPAGTLEQLVQQAKQNPQMFEEYVKQNNPEAYQQAMMIRNSANPIATISQMAMRQRVNPNIMRMLGLM